MRTCRIRQSSSKTGYETNEELESNMEDATWRVVIELVMF